MSDAPARMSIYYPRAMVGDGGATANAWLWAMSLQECGVEVEMLYAPDRIGEHERPLASGIPARPVVHAGRGRALRPRRLGEQIHGTSVLFLHSGYVLTNLLAGAAARRREVPYIVMPQGAYDPHVRSRRRALRTLWEFTERHLLERAAAVHLSTSSEVAHIKKLAPRAQTIIAPTAFPVPVASWSINSHDGYIAWVGRYDIRHKGIDLLLDAMALLPAAQRPTLLMRGRDSSDSRQDVKALVSRRALERHVDVGPPVAGRDKEAFLLRAGAYVHPARWESYGVALVEALAYGIPCLTTTHVGLSPHLTSARAALVVPGTPQGLADGLRGVGHDDLAVGARGRDWVSRHLNHEAAARRLLDQLEALGVWTPS